MANHKSAIKRARQNEMRRLRNKATLSQLRTAIKKFRSLLAEHKADEARNALSGVYTSIDRTKKKGVLHANTAGRYKSRLARALLALRES